MKLSCNLRYDFIPSEVLQMKPWRIGSKRIQNHLPPLISIFFAYHRLPSLHPPINLSLKNGRAYFCSSGSITSFVLVNSRRQWQLLSGVEEEVQKLEDNLRRIRNVLEDAEEKQMKVKDIKHWLENLKETSYEVEDQLDEWNTTLHKLQNALFLKTKVILFIPCFSFGKLFWRRNIAVKIKKINEKVGDIVREKDSRLTGRKIKQHKIESVSFVDESKLHGGDEEKKNIKSSLLSGDHLKAISILGKGRIGKTALAQLVYNDDEVQSQFNEKLWVSVSDCSDLTTISKAVILAFEKHDIGSLPLQILLLKIREKVQGKKFLLVLDDVWVDKGEEWEPLNAILSESLEGSRILVTTRIECVTKSFKSSLVCRLEKLSDDQCWFILRDIACVGMDQKNCEDFEDIGREIAKKSNGLPLVARALGGILQTKSSKEAWKGILNSDIWGLEFAEEKIYNPLFLSYCNLPPAIRPCLLYCAIFPKDFLIIKDRLVEYWMAQGYLKSNENSEMESTGDDYFEFLASCGFFQNFSFINSKIFSCKMHDLIHEFLKFLTKNEFALESMNRSEKLPLNLSSKKPRHLTMVLGRETCFPTSIVGAKGLRSLVTSVHDVIGTQNLDINRDEGVSSSMFETSWRQRELVRKKDVLTNQDLRNLFNHSKCLRLLDLKAIFLSEICHLDKGMPKEIGKLIHLRYLNLIGIWNMKILPETVGELYNLQVLNLTFCQHLEKLPKAIGKLTNLRVLRVLGCPHLTNCPRGLAKLTSLRHAAGIIMRADRNVAEEFSLGDLENLDRLTVLWIKLLGNTIDGGEVKAAKFGCKTHLKKLTITVKDIEEDTITKALNLPSALNVEFVKDFGAVAEDVMKAVDIPEITEMDKENVKYGMKNVFG